MGQSGTCYICTSYVVEGQGHIHHKHIRAAGGSDDAENLVFLCANDHNLLHRCADYIKKNRPIPGRDLASQAFPDSVAKQRRVWELATVAALSEIEFKEQTVRPHQLQLFLDDLTFKGLQALSADYGFKGVRSFLEAHLSKLVLDRLIVDPEIETTDGESYGELS